MKRWWWMACCALSLSLLACRGEPRPRQAILVVLDAARPDRISAYGYGRETTPHLDRLAAEGVVFRNHFAQGTETRTTLPPLLFSRYYVPPLFPADARVPFAAPEELFRRADDQAVALPEALSAAGLRTAMISAHIWLHEDSAFAAAFDEAHDLSTRLPSEPGAGYPDAVQVVDYALAWLDAHRDESFFLYLHLMDTHFPHAYGEDARHFLPPSAFDPSVADGFSVQGVPRRRQLAPDGDARRYLDALYDGSLRFVDRQLGRLFDALDDLRSDVLIAVTADHGEHLLETPGRVLHGGPWLDPVARVPLIMRDAGRLAPGTVEGMTESIDIAPTMLALLDIELPPAARTDGVDLRTAATDSARPYVFTRGAVRDARAKCLFSTPDRLLLAPEPPPLSAIEGVRYDLASDPDETVDRWAEDPAAAQACVDAYRRRMARPYQRYQAAVRTSPPPSPFALSAAFFGIPELTTVPVDALVDPFEGWVRLVRKQRTYLAAMSGAPDRSVRLAVPNGRYALELGHRGACRVTVGDAAPLDVETRAFDPGTPRWTMRGSDLGTVDIVNEQVGLRLAPAAQGLCLVGHVGFTPIDAPERGVTADQERRERLRALGYLD